MDCVKKRECQEERLEITRDSLFAGALCCQQYREGYRFSIDAVLLAHYSLSVCSQGKVLDLCCGSGIVGLIMAYRSAQLSVTGVELQNKLADLARVNSLENGMANRFEVIQGDLRCINQFLAPESMQVVVCNPPYGKMETGRLSRLAEAAIARHEMQADMQDCVRAASFAVQNRGRVVFVYPAVRLPSLLIELSHHRLITKKIQPIYSYPDSSEAKLVLVESMKNGGDHCVLLPPLYIYQYKKGPYSQEVLNMYDPS
ncbi:MAG: hypothetical protein CSA33_06345 [Desulfobulbus propionicus]|nr:MAG: hypothetical protein CSA33_06345 [Desulfobulbus propionicus]